MVGEIHERRREQPFGFLDGCSTELVTRLLADEPVSVVSLILSHVSPHVSAAVLGGFDEERALATVKRMTQVTSNVDCLLSMADDLRDRVRALAAMPTPDPSESLRTIADLLNHSVGDLEKNVMGCLDELEGGGRPGARLHVHVGRPRDHRPACHAEDPGVGRDPDPVAGPQGSS